VNNSTKLQLTLTPQETELFNYKAAQLGYDLTRYIKFAIAKLAEAVNYEINQIPTYEMSEKTAKMVEKDLADYKAGKLKSVKDINDLFK
jgi:hypothetical protein